ncbi:MAG: hypothetical protein M0Q94_02955 [Candidatus Cloacimonetes bacterium]|nr:hypothetical protein [Candidatus Cloacimonadota bacterium]
MANKTDLEYFEKITKKIADIYDNQIYQAVIFNHDDPREDNLLVIIKNDDFDKSLRLQAIVKQLSKKNIPTPLVLTKEFILNSLDSFPLEFLNMQSDYHNLTSEENVLNALQFQKTDIRLQIERELKSKLLLINTNLISISKSLEYERLTAESIISIKPVLKGILFLYGEAIPTVYEEILKKVEHSVHIDLSSLHTAFEVAHKVIKTTKFDWQEFFRKYIRELQQLTDFIDNKLNIL